MTKRVVDTLGAFFGLVVCTPLFVVLALLIKMDSRGPVLFRQMRVGRGFRPFCLYKFRTMASDASKNGGELTIGEDPRVTRIGRFLRQLKLDELPQLFNVLIGDMSLVGPRPEVAYYVEKFKEDYHDVLTVRPGLTDLASLKYIDEQGMLGKVEKPEDEYTNTILPEKIRLAKLYIEHASLAFDLAVIAQTLLQLLGLRSVILKVTDRDNHDEVAFLEGSVIFQLITKYRRPIIITLDLALIVLAYYLAFWLRFDGHIPEDASQLFLKTLPGLLVIRGIAFMIFRLNEGLWRYISIWDLKKITGGVLAGTIVFYGLVEWGFGLTAYPRSIFIIDNILLIGFLCGIRLAVRIFRERKVLRKTKRVLIIGAGDAGENIVREMQSHSTSSYTPVGFVDDDVSKVSKRIHGVKVLGTRQDLSRILHTHKPEEVLVALPGTNSAVLRDITALLAPFNVRIKTLPNLGDILEGKVTISQIRDLAIEDLLQRPPVGLDPQPVRNLIAGKRVLVTGAGGSIGSELCRQIVALAPKDLILYERHENSLYAIAGELADQGNSGVLHEVLGDITDVPRLHETFKTYRPEIIFHAAAHKHVPLMEVNPGEAFKNNILGTRLVAEAAARFGVEHFVLISTDKAVNPSSVMGATKRVAELVVQAMAGQSQTRFLTVRFGNVLGSNGSVVPRFQKQIKDGGPVTVTHPEVRRYFMLIPEAVILVLQAAALGEQGAIYVLEMGGQIKLVDLARNLIRLSGHVPEKNIPIQFIGLRPGEKLEEELVGEFERAVPSSIDKILRIQSTQSLNPAFLANILGKLEDVQILGHSPSVIELLQQLVPTFHRPEILEMAALSEEYQIH
jgi:FlaA1/EpsC-like NDP-sugar epimerase/lipopolysaccharide/colanic/teichoic acid biosynthesis glycosyltransferase